MTYHLNVFIKGMTIEDRSQFGFTQATLPFVFNSAIVPSSPCHEAATAPTSANVSPVESASVQSRGTSPMLPATDSCNEEAKSDVDSDDIIDICDHDDSVHEDAEVKNNVVGANHQNELVKLESTTASECITKSQDLLQTQTNEESAAGKSVHENENARVTAQTEINDNVSKVEVDTIKETKETDSNRNIFKEISGHYDPFLDPQVLLAADGLELLSALAEKSALAIPSAVDKEACCDQDATAAKCEKLPEVKQGEDDKEPSTDKTRKEEIVPKKSRVKFGYATKPEDKTVSSPVVEKKTTIFCGITIPAGDWTKCCSRFSFKYFQIITNTFIVQIVCV